MLCHPSLWMHCDDGSVKLRPQEVARAKEMVVVRGLSIVPANLDGQMSFSMRQHATDSFSLLDIRILMCFLLCS